MRAVGLLIFSTVHDPLSLPHRSSLITHHLTITGKNTPLLTVTVASSRL